MPREFSSPIDLGLPASPYPLDNDQLYEEIQRIYDAIKRLHIAVTNYAGLSVLDPTSYLEFTQNITDSIQVQRLQPIVVTSSEAISANDFVNLWSSTGLKVRKADASGGLAKRAWGWAPNAIANGAAGIVYLLSGLAVGSGLSLGSLYYLSGSSPGGITTTAPVASGSIVQQIGLALSATELLVALGHLPITVNP